MVENAIYKIYSITARNNTTPTHSSLSWKVCWKVIYRLKTYLLLCCCVSNPHLAAHSPFTLLPVIISMEVPKTVLVGSKVCMQRRTLHNSNTKHKLSLLYSTYRVEVRRVSWSGHCVIYSEDIIGVEDIIGAECWSRVTHNSLLPTTKLQFVSSFFNYTESPINF